MFSDWSGLRMLLVVLQVERFFPRDLWHEQVFRPLPGDEDTWFLHDQTRLGAVVVQYENLTSNLAVGHAGVASDRGHTWGHQGSGDLLDDLTHRLAPFGQAREARLPDWALAACHAIREPTAAATL